MHVTKISISNVKGVTTYQKSNIVELTHVTSKSYFHIQYKYEQSTLNHDSCHKCYTFLFITAISCNDLQFYRT